LNIPDDMGVPFNAIVFPENEAEIPEGSPVAVPIPVAPVVVNVIEGESTVLLQSVGLLDAVVTVFIGLTVMVPVALTVPHPPDKGME
jgi:hypothetical protein